MIIISFSGIGFLYNGELLVIVIIEIVKLLCMIKNIYINMFYIILINNGLCEILYVFFG